MASAVIGALRVNLGMDSAEFKKDIKATNRRMKTLGKSMATIAKVASASMVASFTAVGIAMKSTVNQMDKVSKASKGIGMSTEDLSKLAHAAEISGVPFDKLVTSMGKLSKTMTDSLRSATSEQAVAFKALDIEVLKTDGTLKSNIVVLGEVADAFKAATDSTEKTAVAMALFGRAGKDMIPLLNEGSEGIKQLSDEAEKLGIVFDSETAASAEKFNDTITRIKAAAKGFIVQITTKMLPLLQSLADKMVQLSNNSDSVAAAFNLLKGSFDLITKEVKGLRDAYADLAATAAFVKSAFQVGSWKEFVEVFDEWRTNIDAIYDTSKKIVNLPTPGIDGSDASLIANGEKQVIKFASAITTATTQTDKLGEAIGGIGEGVSRFTIYGEIIADSLSRSIDNAIEGTFNLRDAFSGLAKDMVRMMANKAIMNFMGMLFPGMGSANPLQTALSGVSGVGSGGSGLMKFASGGSFDVGGTGGIDSQMVSFMASPNETVSVTKPGQSTGSQRLHITVGMEADAGLNIMPIVKDVSDRSADQAVASYDKNAAPKRIQTTMARYSKAGGNF